MLAASVSPHPKGSVMQRVASIVLLAVAALGGCDADVPSDPAPEDFSVPSGYGQSLSEADYRALDAVAKYQVATKLAAAVYKGIPVQDFFDLSRGLNNPRTTDFGENYYGTFRAAVARDLDTETVREVRAAIYGLDEAGNPQEDLRKYNFSAEARPKEEPYALIHDYPLSRNAFVNAIALMLSNTILFSCAEEMESTSMNDCQKTYVYLVSSIGAGQSIRSIVRGYLPSIMNWRIGRSGQNVGVEGLEEFLGLFDRAEDADKVGVACQDIILLPEDQNYELSQTNFPNTEPQVILQEDTDGDGVGDSGGYYITTCEDFYNVVAGHPLLLPRVCEVVTNYYLAERDPADRLALCDSLIAAGMETFEDLFKGVIFSREYLLGTERVRGFDEYLLPLLDALRWDVRADAGSLDERIWRNMASNRFNRLYMGNMGWATMTYKIGRLPEVPTDPLSFVSYHNALRDSVFFNSNAWAGRRRDIDGEPVFIDGLLFVSDEAVAPAADEDDEPDAHLRPELAALSPSEYLDFLFLTALQRRAQSDEREALLALFGPEEVLAPDVNDVDEDGDTTEQVPVNRWYWRYDENGRPRVNDWAWDDMARATFDYISRLPEAYYLRRIGE
ncbi:MAG: hypothetical protein KatS3mg121_1402 [Gammaproteobacteria bacterium]|nr:MAG: hypothetical protein KatS3mg121_1402 [Gammaproteobacteria bacterium]